MQRWPRRERSRLHIFWQRDRRTALKARLFEDHSSLKTTEEQTY